MRNIKPIIDPSKPKVYIETYGCQMNVNDSEVILSILQDAGYVLTENIEEADVILANTCSIRDNAEQRIWGRIDQFKIQKRKRKGVVIGIVGCMAERLKDELLKAVDIVAGPDSYRSMPELLTTSFLTDATSSSTSVRQSSTATKRSSRNFRKSAKANSSHEIWRTVQARQEKIPLSRRQRN